MLKASRKEKRIKRQKPQIVFSNFSQLYPFKPNMQKPMKSESSSSQVKAKEALLKWLKVQNLYIEAAAENSKRLNQGMGRRG